MTTKTDTAAPPSDMPADRPFATGPVLGVAAVAAVVLVLSATRYGYFGDELYFLAAGRRLSFGYADQGPVLPLLAALADTVAPGSLVALRLPAIVVTVVAVVVSALIAREFGGGRPAQVLTAVGYATSPFLLMQAKNLSTNAIDSALWVLITWLIVRWVRTRRDGLLLAAAVVTAIDMQVKWLIPFFWIALAIGSLSFGPRDLVRRPLLWVGGVIVLSVSIPSLLWQAAHGWPQLGLGAVVREEQQYTGGQAMFVPLAVLIAGALGAVLLCYGVWALLRYETLRPYRFLGVSTVLLLVVFLVSGGRVYYLAGMYGMVFAAGSVALVGAVQRTGSRRRRRILLGSGAALAALSLVLIAGSTPWQNPGDIAPPANDTEAAMNIGLFGEFGWPELAAAAVAAHRSLTPAEQAHSAVLAESYWQAGALDQLARAELPEVHSPSRGFGYFGAPADSATTMVCVGGDEDRMRAQFAILEPIGHVDTRLGFLGNTLDVTLWKCAQPRRPWSQVWPEWMHL
ncbi:glycosyltransferase family 39 protein [Nocardia jinanensis]|uniref:Glycosyl transferase family 39 n=1 Tax=Nocardia jinanensis TaxID=382504 RepID=A0A917R6Y6_9NOCA|nr:glycosyltransferase family 39 protein [Nocardia jinanensis]GGK92628.1 glycosyl transferase family 39 [Nocardia jinanensis]